MSLKLKTKVKLYIEKKKHWHLFQKRNKQAKRELKEVIKNYGPWDYCFMIKMMEICFRHMGDYYHDGYWVMACEAWETYNLGQLPREEIAQQCAHYCQLLLNYRGEDDKTEMDVLNEFTQYLNKYLFYLWD